MLLIWRQGALQGGRQSIRTAPSGAPPVVSSAHWQFWGVRPQWWRAQTIGSGAAPVAAGVQKPIWRGGTRRR